MKTSINYLAAAVLFAVAFIPASANADNGTVRNPFRFGGVHGDQEPTQRDASRPALQMTLLSGGVKIAVFDGREYGVGGEVDGYVITGIADGAVTARGADGKTVFTLEGER